MGISIVVSDASTEADRQAILTPLLAFNEAAAGPSGFKKLAVLLVNEDGQTVGGLWGKFSYDWLTIELLVTPDEARGQGLGRRLVEVAEQAAAQWGCVGIWLDTHGFQAPDFYQKLGYEVFGKLPDHPRGVSRYFLRKMLG